MSRTTFTYPVPLSKSSLTGLSLAEAVGAPGSYSTTSHSGGVHRPGNVVKKKYNSPGLGNTMPLFEETSFHRRTDGEIS
jgi:hypothetical protein